MATLDLQVAASSDDCFVYWNGSAWVLTLTASSPTVGYVISTVYKTGQGLRFLNVTIPQGSTINTAYFTRTAHESRAETVVNAKIRGEDSDDAVTFSDYTNYDGRTRTTAVITWADIAAQIAGSEYNSPEIKTIIQEIIDRGGWASGNALVIFWDDHDGLSDAEDSHYRDCKSYDLDTAKAPKLHIEYTPPAVGRSFGFIIG